MTRMVMTTVIIDINDGIDVDNNNNNNKSGW